MAPGTWAEAQDMLKTLFLDDAQRGVTRSRLLSLEGVKRLEYIQGTNASVGSSLCGWQAQVVLSETPGRKLRHNAELSLSILLCS